MNVNPTEAQAHAIRRKKGYESYMGKKLTGPRRVIGKDEECYPACLLDLESPPDRLYVIGDVDALGTCISIVGARRATPYGKACAMRFGTLAVQRGLTVVSGGALGCDTQAHIAALEAHGRTVSVLGGGIDQLYPRGNRPLFQRIVDEGGCVISEFDWDYPPVPYTFRSRNRIIAALSNATLIVEAGLPSGTFSTADEALAVGREVLVVPGAISSHHSAGSNRLLYQGATPIVDDSTFDDTVSRIYGMLRQEEGASGQSCSNGKDLVLDALQAEPLRLDELAAAVKAPSQFAGSTESWLMGRIAELEARGQVARFPDGRYGPADF